MKGMVMTRITPKLGGDAEHNMKHVFPIPLFLRHAHGTTDTICCALFRAGGRDWPFFNVFRCDMMPKSESEL